MRDISRADAAYLSVKENLMRAKKFFAFIAASCAAGIATPVSAEPVSYVIDAAHTHTQFTIMRFGFNAVIGDFRDVKGEIVLDEDNPENSSVSVEIAVSSVSSGDATRDEHLQGEFWFNAAEYPTITFHSTSVEQTDENTAVVTGDLTILGVTKPAALNVILNKLGQDPATKGPAAGFSATTALKRSEFGIQTAMGLIGDDVSIQIEALGHAAKE